MRRRHRNPLNRRIEIRVYDTTNIYGLPTGTAALPAEESEGEEVVEPARRASYGSQHCWAENMSGQAIAAPVVVPGAEGNFPIGDMRDVVKGTANMVRYRVRFVPALFAADPSRVAILERVAGGIWGAEEFTAAFRVLKIEPSGCRRWMVLVCEQVLDQWLPDAGSWRDDSPAEPVEV